MSAEDMFGIEREFKIRASGVRDVFTPHKPIQSIDLFFGRQKEVQKILEQLGTPGQHALLYGDRGVGKSSLANISTQLLISRIIKGKLYSKRCGSTDTFQTVVSSALTDLGAEINIESQTKTHKQSGKAGLKIPVAEAGLASERTTTTTYRTQDFTASVVADFL